MHAGAPTLSINHVTIAYNGTDGVNLDKVATCTLKNCIVAFNQDDGIVKGGASHSYNLVYGNVDPELRRHHAGPGRLMPIPNL